MGWQCFVTSKHACHLVYTIPLKLLFVSHAPYDVSANLGNRGKEGLSYIGVS